MSLMNLENASGAEKVGVINMPVRYIMFYLKDPYWGIWKKLPKAMQEELKEKLKKRTYRELKKIGCRKLQRNVKNGKFQR